MKWDFKHRSDREYHWEAYYSPQGPEIMELYRWCWQTFGKLGDRWDNYSGWIKFRDQTDVTIFLLRWS